MPDTSGRGLSAGPDPEPPVGTVVRDACGVEWVRLPTGYGGTYWLPWDDLEHGDPESWAKVAGNYGPVTVVTAPARVLP